MSFLIGFLSGVFGGLVGLGGGVIMIAFMVSIIKMDQHSAHGTSLVALVFTGFLSGMMGVGGGSIMVPAMVLLAGFGQHTAQGSSLLAMVPAGGVGAYTHWKLGNVRTNLLAGLIPGILIGTFLGGTFAGYLSDGSLRAVFAAVLIWTGARYLRAKRPVAGGTTGKDAYAHEEPL